MTQGNDSMSGQGKQMTGGGVIPPEAERKLREDAHTLAETAKHELNTLRTEAEGQVRALADEAKGQIAATTDKVKGMAEHQKEALVHELDGVATAVSKVAGELENEQASSAAYARTIADGVQRFSEMMRTKSVDDLIAMAQDLGRRQPAAFIGAAAIAGFAASRFLKASAERRTVSNTGADSYGRYDMADSTNRDAGSSDHRTTPGFRDEMGGLH
jgi:hypothetical protein